MKAGRIISYCANAPINVKPEGGGGGAKVGDLTINAITRVGHWLNDTSLRLGTFDKML